MDGNPLQWPITGHDVTVAGYKIHYIEAGRGEPIVFIHGNPTSSYVWRNVLSEVARLTGKRCIAIDLLGFGGSDKPKVRYTGGLHAAIVAGFIKSLQLQNVILVAEDWGG